MVAVRAPPSFRERQRSFKLADVPSKSEASAIFFSENGTGGRLGGVCFERPHSAGVADVDSDEQRACRGPAGARTCVPQARVRAGARLASTIDRALVSAL